MISLSIRLSVGFLWGVVWSNGRESSPQNTQPLSQGRREMRPRAATKIARPACFGPIRHMTVRTDQVWATELSDKPVNTELDDAV